MRRDSILQLLAPDVGVVDVGGGVEREVAAGFVIGSIHLAQAALFLFCYARHLGFVDVKRSQRLFRRALAGHAVEVPYQLPDLRHRHVPVHVSPCSHAFGKIEPKLRVGHGFLPRPARGAFLVAHVGQHRAPQLTLVQAKRKLGQVAGKRFDVVIVVAGILA